jgi:hypothetical protein
MVWRVPFSRRRARHDHKLVTCIIQGEAELTQGFPIIHACCFLASPVGVFDFAGPGYKCHLQSPYPAVTLIHNLLLKPAPCVLQVLSHLFVQTQHLLVSESSPSLGTQSLLHYCTKVVETCRNKTAMVLCDQLKQRSTLCLAQDVPYLNSPDLTHERQTPPIAW